ncbi:hypothetical protein Tco_0252869 [Tanacetum coccineum]
MDSIISIGQKNTLAEYMILFGADNRPPMFDKDLIKVYAELSAAEKIQADCDMKATNIILQGLPTDIYSLVNHHRVANDLWERVQLLMQGTSLTKQEREHGRMILESVEHSPLIWPTVEESGVIRIKKYVELSAAEKIQADCDMKATI